jgi:AhpD family alkylhydroperoxidase
VFGSGLSPGWDRGSRGTAGEVRADLSAAIGFTGPDRVLDAAWSLAFRPSLEAVALLPVTPDPTLVAFSNNGPLEEEILTSRYPEVFRGFGAVWLSYRLGVAKPDPQAYRALESRLGVEPRQITFLDDSPVNVEAAAAAGWHAELCRSTDDLARVLRAHRVGGGRLPLRDLPEESARRLIELGGRPINLYRTLAAHPALFKTWMEYAWGLRGASETPRPLRELVILRVAQMTSATYEWSAHVKMARAAGVSEEAIAALDRWREAEVFDERQLAALACAEAMHGGGVDDPTFDALRAHFTDAEIIELTLTASTYLGLAALLEALRIPADNA